MNLRLRLRQAYLDSGRRPEQLDSVLRRSITTLFLHLGILLELRTGKPVTSSAEILDLAPTAGLDRDGLAELRDFKRNRSALAPAELVARYENLTSLVDAALKLADARKVSPMNFLLHNPVTDLPGPQFLAFFALVAIVTCFLAYWVRKIVDRTRNLPTPSLPETFDPFEIAYMRGGLHEQKRLVILDLIMRGYLRHIESSSKFSGRVSIIEQAPEHPDPRFLDTDSRMIFDRITSGLKVGEIAEDSSSFDRRSS